MSNGLIKYLHEPSSWGNIKLSNLKVFLSTRMIDFQFLALHIPEHPQEKFQKETYNLFPRITFIVFILDSTISTICFLNSDTSNFGGPASPDRDHTYSVTLYALDKVVFIKNKKIFKLHLFYYNFYRFSLIYLILFTIKTVFL
ncbi:MAG: hypothetical protein ACRCZO_14820 [Cetobacterium sp.]